jgi:Na+/melibiose symporter-like transporter
MKQRALIGWGLGSFTSAALVGAVSLLHLRFMTDSLGIAMGLAGMLVVLSKVYDAVLDPLMGVLSDSTRTPWGRHRPYLFAGAVLAAISLVMLFNVPVQFSGVALGAYCGASLLIFSTAYTMFRIPYLALGRSITQDFNERSRLMTFSVYGSSFGGLAATSAAPLLLASLGSDRAAHGLLAWLLAGLVALGGIATFLLIDTERSDAEDLVTTPRQHFAMRAAWRALAANRPYRNLIGFKLTMFAGLTLHGAALPYYTRHVLKSADTSISSIFLMQTLAMMVSQAGWVRIAKRFGRRKALAAAALGEALAMLCWFLVPVGHPAPWVQILGGFEGLCIGGLMFGLYTMLTDAMDHARSDPTIAGQEGILAGVFVMIEKATSAFGTFIFSMIMTAVGFISAKDAGTVQPAGVVAGITLAMSVLPALAALLACLFLRGDKREAGAGSLYQRPAASLAVLIALCLAVATGSEKAVAAEPAPKAIVIKRITSGEDGKSRLDEVALPPAAGTDPSALVSRLYATDVEIGVSKPGTFIDWHRVSTPRLLVILQGQMEIGTGDGRAYTLKPGDIALAADVTGAGHTSRMIGKVPVMAMTIRLPKDDPLRTRQSSCSDGIAAQDCVANSLTIQHKDN